LRAAFRFLAIFIRCLRRSSWREDSISNWSLLWGLALARSSSVPPGSSQSLFASAKRGLSLGWLSIGFGGWLPTFREIDSLHAAIPVPPLHFFAVLDFPAGIFFLFGVSPLPGRGAFLVGLPLLGRGGFAFLGFGFALLLPERIGCGVLGQLRAAAWVKAGDHAQHRKIIPLSLSGFHLAISGYAYWPCGYYAKIGHYALPPAKLGLNRPFRWRSSVL
jgi:hypothetical protein